MSHPRARPHENGGSHPTSTSGAHRHDVSHLTGSRFIPNARRTPRVHSVSLPVDTHGHSMSQPHSHPLPSLTSATCASPRDSPPWPQGYSLPQVRPPRCPLRHVPSGLTLVFRTPQVVLVPHRPTLPSTHSTGLGTSGAGLCQSPPWVPGPRGQLPPGIWLLRDTETPSSRGAPGHCHPPVGTPAGPTTPRESSPQLTSLTAGHSGQERDSLTSSVLGEAR